MMIDPIKRCFMVVTLGAAACAADPDGPTSEPKSPVTTAAAAAPRGWKDGVSQENKERANALFAEGNQLFAQGQRETAVQRFRAALAIWDHPLIQFNLAVTLLRLEKYNEAEVAMTNALRYGEEPFNSEMYAQALDYQKLLSAKKQP